MPAQVAPAGMAQDRSVFDYVVGEKNSFTHPANGLTISYGLKSSFKPPLKFIHKMGLSCAASHQCKQITDNAISCKVVYRPIPTA